MRAQKQFIDALVVFIPETIKGRRILPMLYTGEYRPHVRVNGEGELIGIAFTRGPVEVSYSELIHVQLTALYHPEVDYSSLQVGTQFTVVEGYRIVAIGQVVKALYSINNDA